MIIAWVRPYAMHSTQQHEASHSNELYMRSMNIVCYDRVQNLIFITKFMSDHTDRFDQFDIINKIYVSTKSQLGYMP